MAQKTSGNCLSSGVARALVMIWASGAKLLDQGGGQGRGEEGPDGRTKAAAGSLGPDDGLDR